MTDDYKYRNDIANYCTRALKEKMFNIQETTNISGKKEFDITFTPKQWFNELDDNMKDNIMHNCRNHIKEHVKELLDDIKYQANSDNRKFNYSINDN
tara:strand:+ start:368 stop:658 length:291 start_codon:yes stop_codon:yes gene_type:complete